MRMRKKPNLEARMERVDDMLIHEPESLCGSWLQKFPGHVELYAELGCGKGRFTVETAKNCPDALLCALERVPDAMVVAMERAGADSLSNVRFLNTDVKQLCQIFGTEELNRIYINFCDPWPKSRDAKHRLTAPDFLRMYASTLRNGGEIHFKTDNLPLFQWSLEQFTAEGWLVKEVTNDLHSNGVTGVMTDYEAKFHEQGIKINRLVAVKTIETKTTAAGVSPRLRNASLTDARGWQESQDANKNREC